ncbi:F-box protein At5g50450-like [Lolium perenne]|uniref:F-box protein At5g50450-like n=1 Tax=Lolium perenne TaxID=4522 RepID=UPI0021F5B7AD|nr:F-box protein At5g50450-like [Lolium perenne]
MSQITASCRSVLPYHPPDNPLRSQKRIRPEEADRFVDLPDDLLITILAKVASGASSSADLANATMTFSRFRNLVYNKDVLKNASASCIAVRAKNWSLDAQHFLQCCADAGNDGASYFLGMILFYCKGEHERGADLIADAALQDNTHAIYSLAVIMFNGSGGTREDRNILAGAGLCSCAARLGHLEALRELGFCLIDGFGVSRSVMNGRRLLLQATAWELSSSGGTLRCQTETRAQEFRSCSRCGEAFYCSRACQTSHWKAVHRVSCRHMEQDEEPVDQANGAAGGEEEADEAEQALDV